MKRGILAALAACCLAACILAGCGGEAAEPIVPVSYTIEERKDILNDTTLKMDSSFYDPEVRAAYFAQLEIIRGDYFAPGSVPDEEFTKFLEIKKEMLTAPTGGYPTLMFETTSTPQKGIYQPARVTIIDGGSVTEAKIDMAVRGNSTAAAPKKPYNIKFEEPVSLFGLEEGRKWSLLANMFDRTMLRNHMALDFGRAIGLDYTSECTFAEVWVNGKYQGNYLVCEPVSDGKNRVGIDTAGHDFILEITPFGGWSFVTGAGVPLLYDSPEAPTEEQKAWLNTFLAEAEKALKTRDMDVYSEYIDVQSFVDFYILMELFKDVDGYWKSLYCYVEDGKLCAGPAWDFDLTCGNVSLTYKEENYFNYHNTNGHGDKSGDSTHGFRMHYGWFDMLLDDAQYAKAVRERYMELQGLITSLYKGEGSRMDELLSENAVSFAREYRESRPGDHGAGWDIMKEYSIYAGESKGDFDANVAFLRTWLAERNAWLLEHIGEK